MLLIIFGQANYRNDLEDGRGYQIAAPDGQFDNGSGTLQTIGNRNLVTTGFI
jgi:hypothetical protein